MNLKYQTQQEMIDVAIIDGPYSVSGRVSHVNRLIKIHINKIENGNTFTTKTGYYLKRLMSETIKLLGSTKNKITKDKLAKKSPNSGITEVILVCCNIANNDYQQDSTVLYAFVPIKAFGYLLGFSQQMLYL